MIDKRLMSISDLLANYSLGNFDYEIPHSDKLDEIDTIIASINMLGEELKETTISRDFFSSVYNTVSNMLFVVNDTGIVIDHNSTVSHVTGLDNIKGKSIDSLIDLNHNFSSLKKQPNYYNFETEIKNEFSKTVFISCSIAEISHHKKKSSYLIVAEDITEKKENETKILQAIHITQESERKRVADDLHDSLGQELSSLKMMLGISKRKTKDPEQSKLLQSSINILESSIQGLRNVCFDLMPSILETEGVVYALRQLIENTPFSFDLSTNIDKLDLDDQQEVAVYRVFQEFINNSIKHSEGSKISIVIHQTEDVLNLRISDNGKGYEPIPVHLQTGRGLKTMKSRIEAFGGKYEYQSQPNQGVTLNITFND